MKSTLPQLDADRLPDGSVELSNRGALVFTFQHWRTDIPTRSTQVVQIKLKAFRLNWKPKS